MPVNEGKTNLPFFLPPSLFTAPNDKDCFKSFQTLGRKGMLIPGRFSSGVNQYNSAQADRTALELLRTWPVMLSKFDSFNSLCLEVRFMATS